MQKKPSKLGRGAKNVGAIKPLEERLRLAREINEYRAAHKGMLLEDVLKAMDNGVSESNYYAWNQRLQLAEATRKANGQDAEGSQSFPLSIIPERPSPAPKPLSTKRAAIATAEDDKTLAVTLLEVAARLLRR